MPAARYIAGVAFLALMSLLIAISIQTYRHALPWQHTLSVTLTTPAAGLSLDPPADVKLRGVIVGQVRSVTSNGNDATLHIALDPGKQSQIPANIDAEILPKTLFGQKYISLLMPAVPSTTRITRGDTIRQSSGSIETEQVFRDLLPVLNTLQPQLLSGALNAIADALDGHGAELGQTITLLNTYLGKLDPHVSTLVHDLKQLASTANVYAASASDIVKTLDNGRAISAQLLVPDQSAFDGFLTQLASTADAANKAVQADGQQLITLSGRSLPVLKLLAQYSSEFPCIISSLVVGNALEDHVIGGEGPYLKVIAEVLAPQHTSYAYPQDSPGSPTSDANNANLPAGITSFAPHCAEIPTQDLGLKDVAPLSYNQHTTTHSANSQQSAAAPTSQRQSGAPASPAGIGSAGSAAEQAFVAALAANLGPGATLTNTGLADVLLAPLLHAGGAQLP